MTEYNELRIQVERDAAERYRVLASGPTGEASGTFTVPFEDLELENFVLKLSRSAVAVRRAESPQMELVTQFGGRLFEACFQGGVRDLYRDASAFARSQGHGLRITLALTKAPELMRLPWEYLYDSPNFLSISAWTPVVRYLDLRRGRPPLPVEPPLRILAMVSSPTSAPALDVARERANLEQALAALVGRSAVEITWLETATLRALQRQLRTRAYHVFHYIGHGVYDAEADDGILLLEDENEQGRPVSGFELGTMLYDHTTLRLAVLNACEGARTSLTDPFAGVACSLVQREIPAVIAMQFEITDRAAIVFAEGFYGAVSDGYPVDAALAEARKAIFADRNDVEWGTPVLFMRVPDGRIFDVAPLPAPVNGDRGSAPPPDGDGRRGQAPPHEPEPQVARPWWRHSRWVAAGAITVAAAVAAVVLALVLAGRGGPGAARLDWSLVRPDDPLVFGGARLVEMTAVAPQSNRGDAVAVGFARDGLQKAAIWSYTPRGWRRESYPVGRGAFWGVAERGGTVVAVGRAGPDNPNDPRQDALVWTFSGGTGERVCRACGDGINGGGHKGQQMWAVTAWRAGFVAVGYDLSDADAHYDAAVWTSRDGQRWSRVRPSAAFGPERDQVMRGVTATGGGVVAVGWDRHSGAVWTSRDGRTWLRVARGQFNPAVSTSTVHLNAVVRMGTQLVAVGEEGNETGNENRPGIWVSDDLTATSWQHLELSLPAGARTSIVRGAVPAGDGVLAVGFSTDAKEKKSASAWLVTGASQRADAAGLRVEMLEGPFAGAGSYQMDAVTALPDRQSPVERLVAVGFGPSASTAGELQAQVWEARTAR